MEANKQIFSFKSSISYVNFEESSLEELQSVMSSGPPCKDVMSDSQQYL